jgi:hypothetical protein
MSILITFRERGKNINFYRIAKHQLINVEGIEIITKLHFATSKGRDQM